MALQLGALNQALRSAGVADDLARAAAEEVAGYDSRLGEFERLIDQRFNAVDQRFNAVDQRFSTLEREMDQRFNAVERRIAELRAYVDERIAELSARMDQRFTRMNTLLTVLTGLVLAVFVKQFFR